MDIESELTSLRRRVESLEALAGIEHGASVTPAPPQRPVAPMPPPPPIGAVAYSPEHPGGYSAEHWPQGPSLGTARERRSFEFGIETVLRWAGVALVTLAGIFLVSTAISRGWVGPELQLLGAALGGGAMLAGSVYLNESRRPWALALGCGGAVVMVACAVATYEWLELVEPEAAVALTALATAGSIAVALRTRLEGTALVASLAALFGALETLGELGDAPTLAWVVALILISSAIGILKQWPGLRLITGWLGAAVLAIYALSEDVDGLLQIAGFVGTALVAGALWAGPIMARHLAPNKNPGQWGSFLWAPVDYRLVALVPGWVWVVTSGLLSLEESIDLGTAALIVAAGFGALTLGLYGRTAKLVVLSTIFGSLTLLSVGFAFVFDGPALMVAFVGQAATSYYLGHKLRDIPLQVGGYVSAAIASILAIYEMLEALDNDGFENFGAIVATLVVVAMWVVSALLAYRKDPDDLPFEIPFAGAWVMSMLWLATLLSDLSQGLGFISAAWATMACVGLIVGLTNRIDIVKNVALGTLGLTLVKLVTIDMAEVDVFWRVGLFFVVGVGLIALGLKIPALMEPDTEESGSDNQSGLDQPGESLNL